MAYIDDDTLVIGLDPMAMYFDLPVEPELLQHILDIDEPVEIQYVAFEDEASASQTKSWQDRYKKSCMPVKSGYQNVCKVYKNVMKRLGIPLPTGITTSTTTSTTTPTQTNTGNPCDTSARSTACYYYKQYEQKCTNGKTYKRCNTYATQIKSAGYSLPGSSGTQTVTTTVTPSATITYELNNVQAAKSGDDITLSWDAPTGFKVEYYKIYVTDNDRYYKYKGKINKSATSYTLSDVTEGKSYKFKIKLYYENTRGSTGIKYFYSNSVDVPRIVIDRIAPVITVPSGMNVKTPNLSGDTVRYIVDTKDNVDPRVSVTCSPASGTKFSVGSTTVSCSATDTAGNTATKTFTVTVSYDAQRPTKSTKLYGASDHDIVRLINNKLSTNLGGTVTFGATNISGEKGLVVSGHVLKMPTGHVFFNHTADGVTFSTDRGIWKTSGTVDAGFIPITEPNLVIANEIKTQNNKTFAVTEGSLDDTNVGSTVSMYGQRTESDGLLLFKNATIYPRTGNNILLTEIGIATYASLKGDSGAPIIHHKDGSAYLIGSNRGTTCVFDSHTAINSLVNVTNNKLLCPPKYTDSTVSYYKVFSAWENIKKELNLQ